MDVPKCNFLMRGRSERSRVRSSSPSSLPPHSLSLPEELDWRTAARPTRRNGRDRPRPPAAVTERTRLPNLPDSARRQGAADFLEIQERNPISRYRCILKHQRTSLIEQRAERAGRKKVCRQKKRSVELAMSQRNVQSREKVLVRGCEKFLPALA